MNQVSLALARVEYNYFREIIALHIKHLEECGLSWGIKWHEEEIDTSANFAGKGLPSLIELIQLSLISLDLCCILSQVDNTKSTFLLEANVISWITSDLRNSLTQPGSRSSTYNNFFLIAEYEGLTVNVNEIKYRLIGVFFAFIFQWLSILLFD